jgi:hypothetical protein
MYKILYNDDIIFDPYDENARVSDAKMTGESNKVSYLDFTIALTHPLYDIVAERDGIVKLYSDDTKLFEGVIETIETDIYGSKDISCVSALSYLEDTLVRSYNTSDADMPTSIDGFFQWLIDQHNSHVLSTNKQFIVGVNQAGGLSISNIFTGSNTSYPTTFSEITDKILHVYGGYLVLRYENDLRYLDIYADVHDMNSQIIDFGVNITNFTKTIDTKDQYTAVLPIGSVPQGDNQTNVTIKSYPDGVVSSGNDDLVKAGDCVYSVAAVQKYGYREVTYSYDTTDQDTLLQESIKYLTSKLSPALTLDIKAVDLALYKPDYTHLNIGQAVRVRSKLHDEDEYLIVESVDINLNNPEQTEYVLGTSYDTLTGQQSGYLKSLNSSINTAIDKAASISADVKELSTKVPLSEDYEYASSASKTVAPDDGWGSDMPYYIAGKYLWQRVTKHYENNVTTISEPVMITGNSSAVLKIKSTNGLQFKNGIIKTSFYVSVYYGNEVIDTLTDLRLLYGETATLIWSVKNTEDSDPIVIQASDPRLGNDGFRMDITADDVNTKATFYCELYS